ncbi:small GTP-binding protein, putative [Trichomonas vaginalis G3]|uniref:Small GTP-binding protein, putative n=1 Tax=Trichomonas vaginalis (strain ATCC PRA-98 / G3) TaxID=412133 RepID=A2GEQ6_TRIV3|nr:GTPase protein [Trichomonas vaginalis G3]EAX84362.1 small GTP-binding protein, putative [Trichomonas vaginalis G3]KAI5531497.1 GTPase protein [Trichomonas vaginalis G3]|eukprot:XP_001297292.1 small GTP-binding protein [Trichomonas vaginalis G3]
MSITAKVVLVGDSRVGKTSILHRITTGDSNFRSIKPTISGNSERIPIEVDGKKVTLDIWDTAGTEAYQSLAPMFARNAQVCLCVFDLNDQASFDSIPGWIQMMEASEDIPYYYIIGNKSDLETKIPQEQLDTYINHSSYRYYQVSALTGYQIDVLFDDIARDVSQNEAATAQKENINLESQPEQNQKGCC